MSPPLSLFIALRFAKAKRRNRFISFIALVSMLGMSLGVAVLILVLSVMNGFDQELRTRILGAIPHATIYPHAGVDDWRQLTSRIKRDNPFILGAAPVIEFEALLSGARAQGTMVHGIVPEAEAEVSIVGEHFVAGGWDGLQAGGWGIVLGDILASVLGVGLGSNITLILPEVGISAIGLSPRLRRFEVVGIFSMGADLDARLALIHLADARKLQKINHEADGIRLHFDDVLQARAYSYLLANNLGQAFGLRDWTHQYGNLFASIRMEKTLVGLLLFLIIAVAAFNIVSTLVMTVTDKQGDIAIARTFGASRGLIMRVFILNGLLTGVIGTAIGVILGVLAALNISAFIAWIERLLGVDFLSAETYFISYLPSKLIYSDVVLIASAALAISLIATIYPAYKATRIQPADALRYE